jgi:hypothetical protein
MRTMLRILVILVFPLCGSVALAQQPATNPAAAPPATEIKAPGAKSGGTATINNGTLQLGSGGNNGTLQLGSGGTGSISFLAKKPEPGSLEEMLDSALRNNPDIRAAEAKVRAAEAESNSVRNQVIAKVVHLRTDIELAKKMLAHAEKMEQMERRVNSSQTSLLAATANVDTQKAELARLEADLKAMLGSYARIKSGADLSNVTSGQGLTGSVVLNERNFTITSVDFDPQTMKMLSGSLSLPAVQAPMAERIKNALEKPIQLGEMGDVSVTKVVDLLTKSVGGGITFRVLPGKVDASRLWFAAAEMSLGAWLQMIEDSIPGLHFVVRDYGILATMTVPEGAMTVQQFWKQQAKPKSPAPKADPNLPPPPMTPK